MTNTLSQAYAACAEHTRAEAKNFYYAFVALPRPRRKAIYALYSYCRTVDDAADLAPSLAQASIDLNRLRDDLSSCLSGRPPNLMFVALADVIERYDLQPAHLLAVIDGAEQDLRVKRYESFEELRAYCWQVAGAVGLLSLQVFGYSDPRAIDYAEDLGLAMQLTNILRDIGEDLKRGRIYLPQDELAQFDVTEEALRTGVVDDAFQEFMRFQIGRARRYFASGSMLIPFVLRRSRICPIMLRDLYLRVLDHIEQAQYDVFSQRRGPSKNEKMRLLLGACLQCLLPKRR